MLSIFFSCCSLIISVIGCSLSIYNFIEARTRKKFEKSCLLESRFLTIRTQENKIVSITFRFCLTNISDKSIVLQKIYFKHPAFNFGKKILIDQIRRNQFIFETENEFKSFFKIENHVLFLIQEKYCRLY